MTWQSVRVHLLYVRDASVSLTRGRMWSVTLLWSLVPGSGATT